MKRKLKLLILRIIIKILRKYYPLAITPVFDVDKNIIFHQFKWSADIEKIK